MVTSGGNGPEVVVTSGGTSQLAAFAAGLGGQLFGGGSKSKGFLLSEGLSLCEGEEFTRGA